MVILSFGVAVALGWTALRLCAPLGSLRPRWAARLLEACLAFGLGAGLTSSAHFFLLLAGAPGRFALFAAEWLLLAGGAALLLRRKTAAGGAAAGRPFPWNWFLAAALCLAAALAAATFFDSTRANPHGLWDAWSIWNVRARFLAADGDSWRNAYSPLLVRTHPDYPLLLSSFIARCWKYAGGTPAAVPIAASFLFFSAAAALLVSCAALARSAGAGLLAGLVLLANSAFVAQGPAQYADLPLSFYILAAAGVWLLAERFEHKRNRVVAVSGLLAALAGWTKNEGILFFAVFFLALFVVQLFSSGWRTAFERQAWFLAGAAPVLLITAVFKLFLAPAADPLVTQSFRDAAGRLGETGRYLKIARAFWAEAKMLGSGWTHPAVLLAVLAVALRFQVAPRQRTWIWTASLTTGAMAAGYFGVYLITPSGLDWHLATSLGRLYVHLWPLFLLLFVAALRCPEDFQKRA